MTEEIELPKDYQAYLDSSAIPREANITDLSKVEIDAITRIVFFPPDVQPADLLFIFGTSNVPDIIYNRIAEYYRQGVFRHILATGLLGRAYYETGKPLAHNIRDGLIAHGMPAEEILLQDRSTNTLEDVQFSHDLLDSINPLKNITFLSKSHHSGRCLRTLRKFFPDLPLSAMTYDAEYEGVIVTRESWPQHPISRGRVYGEYMRIKKYSAAGDIAP